MAKTDLIKLRRIGILDIGSNSVRFVIYELFGAAFTPIYNEKVLAGLGRDLRQTGALNPEGCEQALAAIKRFCLIAKGQGIPRIIVGATAALREAEDAKAFIQTVREETDVDISPVSGEDEARLTAQGLIAAMPDAAGIAADLGGASLELTAVNNRKIEPGHTFALGPFKVIGPTLSNPENFNVEKLSDRITQALRPEDMNFAKGQSLYLIGGAWRNLMKIYQDRISYPLRMLQAYTLPAEPVQNHAKWAYGPGLAEVLNWKAINTRRAETLPYGALLLDILITRLKPKQIIVSTAGLREGLIYDSLSEDLKRRNALFDGCRDLARGNLHSQNFAEPLFEFLQDAAQSFPSCFAPKNETRLRRAACYLAGIGKGLNVDYQASLVFNNVFYAPLVDLTHKERAYLSLILYSSFTQKQSTPNAAAIETLLSKSDQNAARCFGAAMRLGVVACGRSSQLLQAYKLRIDDRNHLLLEIDKMHKDLITRRVELRLRKLAGLLDMEYRTGIWK